MNLEASTINSDIGLFIEYPHFFGQWLGYKDLTPIHTRWIIDAWIKDDKKAMQAHRNSYKTTSILIVGAIWYLLFHNPDCTILFIRKAEKDAQKIVLAIMAHLETPKVNDLAKYIYKVDTLKTDRWSTSSLDISIRKSVTPEGTIEAKGTTSAIVGSHYDKIFPDDIITIRDRTSKAEREWIKMFVAELNNIKKHNGKIYFSGTPWHKDDAWTIIPEPDKYPIGSIYLPGYSRDELQDTINDLKSSMTLSMYAANYELKHIADEGRIFGDPIMGKWPEKIKKICAYVDPAYHGKNNTAISLYAESTEHKHHVRGWTWRKHIDDCISEVLQILHNFNCGTCYVEGNADKGYSARKIMQNWPSVKVIEERENKHIKIIKNLKPVWNSLIFAEDCQDEYLNNVIDYQEGQEPDDEADSLAALAREMGLVFGNTFEVEADGMRETSKMDF